MTTTPRLRGPRFNHALAIVLVGMLCTACTSISPPPPLAEDSRVQPVTTTTPPNTSGVDPYVVFNRALLTAQSESAKNEDQINLLNQGFALVDFRCNRYFTALGKAEQDLRFTRKQTTLTSGIVLSALGLASASAKTIANVGAMFSFGTASMDSYADAYIFSPDVKAVQRLVADAMGSYRTKFIKESGSQPAFSYTSAVSTLAEYESFCEPHGIRDLVNKSLAQVRTTTEPPSSTVPTPSVAAPAAPPIDHNGGKPPEKTAGSALQMMPRIDVRVVPR